MAKKNIGILVSQSWNSKEWQEPATEDDLKHSKFGFVKNNMHMHEDLNFAHESLPCEDDGTYIAYTPMFNRLPSLSESKDVEIIFFRSTSHHNKK